MASTTPSTGTQDGLGHDEGETWSPSSWTKKPIMQKPLYPDHDQVQRSVAKLTRLPPIVQPGEILQLKAALKKVALGQAFVIHGGDCAELFDYCEQTCIESKLKLLLQLSMILTYGANKPVVRIGRLAGQYAKPRSSPTEVVDGIEVPSFRGDILNGYGLDQRTLDPKRLVDAYYHSASTLNFIRGALATGFADLRRPLAWELGYVHDSELKAKYSKIVNSIIESLRFMQTIGADNLSATASVDLYTSHEGLLLDYEQALTRFLPHPHISQSSTLTSEGNERSFFDTSAHFLWLGDRTRQTDGAHVEFFRGIENPLGVKIGPNIDPSDLLSLLRKLNPSREIGKVTLITRYGASRIRELLPLHIRVVEESEYHGCVIWQCDPMHGNTRTTAAGVKTRQFVDIFSELHQALEIHAHHSTHLGGIHLEVTGDMVTECTGGSDGLVDTDLGLNYTSFCDPRLNEHQTLEMGFLIASHLREASRAS